MRLAVPGVLGDVGDPWPAELGVLNAHREAARAQQAAHRFSSGSFHKVRFGKASGPLLSPKAREWQQCFCACSRLQLRPRCHC